MKILELRFKNLNSLYGTWRIDFTAPEYTANGIFALTGPTGAGKSTILDAICLALYGETPRLGKVTKSGNEIMSRRTGECFAEVVFESQAGRFRCHWGQHRARKKADGNLADYSHEISDADSGTIIENKRSLVAKVIEEKTGMDFERFRRSILLAQGGFDTFLKADAEQKSRILEQITGTEIYTQISIRVHERQRQEKQKLDVLDAEITGIAVLSPEQEEQIKRELLDKQKVEDDLLSNIADLRKAIDWLRGIERLKQEIGTLDNEAEELQRELEAFKPERNRLESARKAAAFDGEYAALLAMRKDQAADKTALKAEEDKLPELVLSVERKTQSLNNSRHATAGAKEELKKAAETFKEVRAYDQELAAKKKAVDEMDAQCKKDAARIETDKCQRENEREKRDAAIAELKFVTEYLESHSADEWLAGGLAGIEERLAALSGLQKDIAVKDDVRLSMEASIRSMLEKLNQSRLQLNAGKQTLEDAGKQAEQMSRDLAVLLDGRLLREYRADKEALLRETALIARITELEDHRARLEDGKPCPLCGATEHPFASGNIPDSDAVEKKIAQLSELITRAEELESAIKDAEKSERKAAERLTALEKQEITFVHEKESAERRLEEACQWLTDAGSRMDALKLSLTDKLGPLGITEIPDDVSSLLRSLKERLASWQERSKEKADIEKQVTDLDRALERSDAVIRTQVNALDDVRRRLDDVRSEYDGVKSKREILFSDRNPDVEEDLLHKAIDAAARREQQADAEYAAADRALVSARTTVSALQQRIGNRTPCLEDAEREFVSVVRTAGFADEAEFEQARLSVQQKEKLTIQAQELDERQTSLRALLADRRRELAAEATRKISDSTLDELEPAHKRLEEESKRLHDEIVGLRHRLDDNSAAIKRFTDKRAAFDAQKRECERWSKLHALIGSADGKKYRAFAQGLTFELMVSHANRQLEKLTDRYLLIHDEQQPLELSVIDAYQAGEIRSAKNLSGGESFIVSLSLALGLSKMASRKVRVDSLFLDEGFGTLDDEALETALETLGGLQQDGKLIGVVSHVSALKERIGTQIRVHAGTGGKSTISGPGCEKISDSARES
jgi:exonuclease SbcC